MDKNRDVISKVKTKQAYFESDTYLQKIVNDLIYEVKIRIPNGKE